jgi:hypothetical protein
MTSKGASTQYAYSHSFGLAKRAFDWLSDKRHGNNCPVAVIYGRGWEEQSIKFREKNITIISKFAFFQVAQ